MKKIQILFVFISTLFLMFDAVSEPLDFSDGQVKTHNSNQPMAWDSLKKQWLSIEDFWLAYAKRSGGITWGKRTDYPPYSQVKEFDTLLIKLEKGSCLMEFFHSRWRRANDVRRWDDAFNQYGGCPKVFD